MIKLLFITALALLTSGCTHSTTIDAQIEKYMEEKGQAKIEAAVQSVLLEASASHTLSNLNAKHLSQSTEGAHE